MPVVPSSSRTVIVAKSFAPRTALVETETAVLKAVLGAAPGRVSPVIGNGTATQVLPGWKVTWDITGPSAPVVAPSTVR